MKKFEFVQIDLSKPPEFPDPLFKMDDDGVTLKWGGYDYFIEWKRLKTQGDILRWLCHIGQKEWEEATSYRISEFIHAVFKKRGWNLHPLP